MKTLSKKTPLDIAREEWNAPDAVRIRQILGLTRMAIQIANWTEFEDADTQKEVFRAVQGLHEIAENNLVDLLPRDPAVLEAIETLRSVIGG